MTRSLCTFGVLLTWASVCYGHTIKHADCGTNGTLQLVYDDGTTKQQPKESVGLHDVSPVFTRVSAELYEKQEFKSLAAEVEAFLLLLY